MAFMIPQYSNAPFVLCVDDNDEGTFIPEEWYDVDCHGTIDERYEGKWFCRLSAPGYRPCTHWSGPFDNEDEAREHMEEEWEVDPDTGDSLDV